MRGPFFLCMLIVVLLIVIVVSSGSPVAAQSISSSISSASTSSICTLTSGAITFDLNSLSISNGYSILDSVEGGVAYDFNVCQTVTSTGGCPNHALGPAWQRYTSGPANCVSLGGSPLTTVNVVVEVLDTINIAAGVTLRYIHGATTPNCSSTEFQMQMSCSNTVSGPSPITHPSACVYRTAMTTPHACPLQCPTTAAGAICSARGACVSTPIGSPTPTGVGCLCFNESSLVPQPIRSDCPPDTSHMSGDPRLVGLQGQEFQIHGAPGEIFNLISQPNFQLNSRFVYLSTGSCQYNSTECWSHPGTYLGQLGFNFAANGSNLMAVSGPHGEGMRLFLGGSELSPSVEPVTVPSIRAQWAISDSQVRLYHFTHDSAIIRFSHRDQLLVETSDWLIRVTNSDHFFNLDVALLQPEVMRLGSTFVRLPSNSLSNGLLDGLFPSAPIHGLIGQTWKNVEYMHGGLFEGDPLDYIVDDADIFGSSFIFNQFNNGLPLQYSDK